MEISLEISIPKFSETIVEQIRLFESSTIHPLRIRSFNFVHNDIKNELVFPPTTLLALSDCADLSRPYPVTSHRKYSGRYIVFIKKILMKAARPILKFFFQRQIFFNDNIVIMTHAVVALESRINYLESLLNKQKFEDAKNTTF